MSSKGFFAGFIKEKIPTEEYNFILYLSLDLVNFKCPTKS